MEWYEELEQKYIELFKSHKLEDGTVVPVRGIEVNDSWKPHVIDFLKSLEWHRTHNRRDDKDNKIKIFQIKEKFGQVTAYVDAPEYIYNMIVGVIGRLEGRCSLTCYGCGKLTYDLVQTKGWISYICQECFDKKESK